MGTNLCPNSGQLTLNFALVYQGFSRHDSTRTSSLMPVSSSIMTQASIGRAISRLLLFRCSSRAVPNAGFSIQVSGREIRHQSHFYDFIVHMHTCKKPNIYAYIRSRDWYSPGELQLGKSGFLNQLQKWIPHQKRCLKKKIKKSGHCRKPTTIWSLKCM